MWIKLEPSSLNQVSDEARIEKVLSIGYNDISGMNWTLLGTFLNEFPNLIRLYMNDCKLLGDVMNDMMKAIAKDELKLKVFNIANNDISGIVGTLLGTFLSKSPYLFELNLDNCKISGDIMNEMISVYAEDELQLQELYIGNNDFCFIDSTLLGIFLRKSPKLLKLYMRNCSLSDDVVNAIHHNCKS
ncbi:uncharacterized protein [Antedon mediterranea]|uniref:uncharacterized protein n=1 Tax=Antedon mediterranea TaxID=105859 RepID=UPI003AF7F028